jgi:hypothetical protein
MIIRMEKIHAESQRTPTAIGHNISMPDLMQFLHCHDSSNRKK